MALFGGGKDGFDGREAVTLVGQEAYFHGVLSVKGALRVDGSVEGDVSDAVTVEVGKKGRIKGNVATETLSVAGAVEGDVVASRSVELLPGGRLKGDLRTPSLRIEEGALFDGRCAMTSPGERKASETRPLSPAGSSK